MDISLDIKFSIIRFSTGVDNNHMQGTMSQIPYLGHKPIFHQNAKLLALGTFASPNAKDSTFALPNAKNTNMLVSLALGDAHFSRFTRRETEKLRFT